MINDSGVDVAATLPGLFTRSEGSFGSDLGNNQLGVTSQHSVWSNQGNKGIASYMLLSRGLDGSPANAGVVSNPLGWKANVLTAPLVADGTSDGVQVSLSLFPSVRFSDKRASIDNAQFPTPVQQCLRPPPRTKKPRQPFARNDNICGDWWTGEHYRKGGCLCDYDATYFVRRSFNDKSCGGWNADHASCAPYEWWPLHVERFATRHLP